MLVAANVFCKRVDEPIVRLARWVEQQLKAEDRHGFDPREEISMHGLLQVPEQEGFIHERDSVEGHMERGLVGRPSLS